MRKRYRKIMYHILFDLILKFMETDMIDGLYWETLYNVGYKRAPGQKTQPLNCPFDDIPATAPCPVDPADRNIMYENRMLGFPRLRMVRLQFKNIDNQIGFNIRA